MPDEAIRIQCQLWHLIRSNQGDKQNSWRVKRHIHKLAKRSQVVLAILAGGADPPNGARNNEAFEGVVRESRCLAFERLIEDVRAAHYVKWYAYMERGAVVLLVVEMMEAVEVMKIAEAEESLE